MWDPARQLGSCEDLTQEHSQVLGLCLPGSLCFLSSLCYQPWASPRVIYKRHGQKQCLLQNVIFFLKHRPNFALCMAVFLGWWAECNRFVSVWFWLCFIFLMQKFLSETIPTPLLLLPPFPLPISRFSLLVYWNKPSPILWMRILLKDSILGFLTLNILTYTSNAMAERRRQNGTLTATGLSLSLCCQTESTEVEYVRQL